GAKIAKDFSDFTQTRRGMALELAIQNQDRIAATAEMYVGGAAIGTGVMAPAGVYLVGHGSDALRAANMRRRYPRSDLGNTVVFLGFRNGFELGGMSRESAAEAAATLEQGMSMAAMWQVASGFTYQGYRSPYAAPYFPADGNRGWGFPAIRRG